MSTLYSDNLVEITDETITFKRFTFGLSVAPKRLEFGFSFRPKPLPLSQIARVEERPPSLLSGKWRIWGSGDFRTWFPLDWHRPQRDKIFIASVRGSRKRIGFTVEDSRRVRGILKEKGLLSEQQPAKHKSVVGHGPSRRAVMCGVSATGSARDLPRGWTKPLRGTAIS
jgi:hypothetical protein